MLLQIIVPHYKENVEYLLPLLDSVQRQQFINKDDFEVLVINDGFDCVIEQKIFDQYTYNIKYLAKPWGGTSSTRQFGQDLAKADYVMFCDCDDMFNRIDALWLIFDKIKKDHPDKIVSSFNRLYLNGTIENVVSERAGRMCLLHGKVYRRQFLVDNNIYWKEDLSGLHEDYFFHHLQNAACPKTSYIADPIYIWKQRENSLSNLDSKQWKYEEIKRLKVEYSLVHEMKSRGHNDIARVLLISLLFNLHFSWPAAMKDKELTKFITDIKQKIYHDFADDIKTYSYDELNSVISLGDSTIMADHICVLLEDLIRGAINEIL